MSSEWIIIIRWVILLSWVSTGITLGVIGCLLWNKKWNLRFSTADFFYIFVLCPIMGPLTAISLMSPDEL